MPKFQTKVDPNGAEFRRNATASRALVEQLRRTLDEVEAGGSEEARARHLERNKLPVRTRIAKLLDPDTPFLEIGKLAAHGVYDVALPGRGTFDTISEIQDKAKETKTVFLTGYLSDVFIEHALAIGAYGYLMKGEPTGNLIDALRRIKRLQDLHAVRRKGGDGNNVEEAVGVRQEA